MKLTILPVLAMAGVLALAPIAHGKEPNVKGDHAAHGASHGATMGNQTAMTDGEIKRIDKGSGKLTIKHGEIKHMQMPPMTMVFEVADKAMMADLKKGEMIRFAVEDRDGKMVVTGVERR